jgi:hypothetical protein
MSPVTATRAAIDKGVATILILHYDCAGIAFLTSATDLEIQVETNLPP